MFTLIGDAVTTAARVESMTNKAQASLLVSEPVYEHVRDLVSVGRRFRTPLKGKTGRFLLYEVVGAHAMKDTSAEASKRIVTNAFHCLAILFFNPLLCLAPSEMTGLAPDESAILFPTYGRPIEDGAAIDLHSWIFEPEFDSARRRAVLALLDETLEDESAQAADSALFEERARWFFVDSESGKPLRVQVGETHAMMPASDDDGHSHQEVLISGARALGEGSVARVLRADGSLVTEITVPTIAPSGTSVISDIDDTIKISDVNDRSELIQNTFFRRFQPVPGMAGFYGELAQSGCVFHYVSGSPWQLYPVLQPFLRDNGLPEGSMHMRRFHPGDRSFFDFLRMDQQSYKSAAIDSIMDDFPDRSFVLIGDSGESDPEIYFGIARSRGEQVRAILIRDVTGETAVSERYQQLLASLPVGSQVSLRVFLTGRELMTAVDGLR